MSLQTEADEFAMLFKRHLNGSMQAQIRWVTCQSVDWDAKTMIAVGISDDLEYYDISLGFGSLIVKPTLNTDCLIAILEGQESVTWVLHASEVDAMVFNGGENDGLTNTTELKTQLDKTNELLQAVITVLTGSPIPEPGNGSPSALQTALKAAITGKELGDYSQIEDTKITH